MNLGRRKFLRNGTYLLIAIGFVNSTYGRVISLLPKSFISDITDKLLQAAILRRAGNFTGAKAKYDEVLLLKPTEIRAYDGIRKILLHTKFHELEVLQLYLSGMFQNPLEPIFKERVAKEYMRLTLGNKKFTVQLNENQDLLQKARDLFTAAKLELPNSEQILKQLEKADRKISFNANQTDARDNSDLIYYKKGNQLIFKNRFAELPSSEVKQKLDSLLLKETNSYRKRHIREVYKIYIRKLKAEGYKDLAAQMSKVLYLFDKNDSNALKLARNTCRQEKKYAELEAIERENAIYKHTYWAKIALFDVLLKRYNFNGVGNLNEMKNILSSANSLKKGFTQTFECKIREIKIAIAQNNSTQAFSLLNNFADFILGIESAHFIDRFNIASSQYYRKIGDRDKAVLVIALGLKEPAKTAENAFLEKVKAVNKNKDVQKPIHNERLNNFRIILLNESQ